MFLALRASVWSKNKGDGAGPLSPSLGSATVISSSAIPAQGK